jgi:hypothetical protein
MRKILLYGLLAAITGNAFAISTLTGASTTGTTIKFTTKLSEKLTTGYKVKLDLNNGKALASMTCSALTCTLSSNNLPKGADEALYSAGIYNSKGTLQGEVVDGSYVITTTEEVNTPSTIGYTKISNSGATLSTTAKLGTGSNDWTCTKDNKTGLIWEVKTTDGGLRDMNNDYSWYELDASKNNGDAGTQNGGICKGSQCDTYAFTKAVNTKGLCGKKDWRMPTVKELEGLLITTPTINQPLNERFYIDATYFPNSNTWFWSSSLYASGNAWYVNFDDSSSDYSSHGYSHDVRLVRAATAEANKTSKTFSYTKISNSGATLPATAKLGTGSNDWACTKDTKTGLTWEVKNTDGGLQDMENTYTWYEPDASKNGGFAGYQNGYQNGYSHPEYCKGSQCDTYAFTTAVNANGLCGKKDWRMPTVKELEGLLTKTPTINQPLNEQLYIDATYFPNSYTWFWASSPHTASGYARYVDFDGGYSNDNVKYFNSDVRLVRG